MNIRWGILGTGKIANVFANNLKQVALADLSAVGSRDLSRAKSFAKDHSIAKPYGSYEELAKDTKIDVIYISTPHPFHCENTLMCLNHGKAVLCEKPFAINAEQAGQMILTAKKENLFLMEAMWTRFLPAIIKTKKWIDKGKIGTVRFVNVDFGFQASFDEHHRLFNPQLGGGALLDVGVYALAFCSMVFEKKPKEIKSFVKMAKTGVDEQAVIILQYDEDQLATITCSTRVDTPNEAMIMGTKGRIHMPAKFWGAESAVLIKKKQNRVRKAPLGGKGFVYEIEEVNRCLRQNRLQSEYMPLNETLAIMEIMDDIRAQWNLSYPTEK
ncbi:gfo/Idh/MocA family oxidoreductase [candidate division KSB1 bacterium]|nr:gfo/Idh/MocA family oxidoreductase [candidate division KSB1 bacterium]